MSIPRIHVAPFPLPAIIDGVGAGGGRISEPAEADAIIWTNPGDPQGLATLLKASPARWVQLPFAGIESFFEAGVIDGARIWTCAKGTYAHATAEQALTLMLTASRLIHVAARSRAWLSDTGERKRLAGSTAVVVGAGAIGRELIAMLAPLRVDVIAINRSGAPVPGAARTAPVSDLHTVLPEAGHVVITTALTEQTRGLIDAAAFELMRPDAWLTNVARGPIVDHDALVAALQKGSIAGAMLDVTDPEPLPDDHPLWGFDNVVITSHTANTATMAVPELAAQVERNVAAFAAGGELQGLVDVSAGY
jgi:phosphoglycerate dehydrogenase-like enzyme